jgi:hypothetical protein
MSAEVNERRRQQSKFENYQDLSDKVFTGFKTLSEVNFFWCQNFTNNFLSPGTSSDV